MDRRVLGNINFKDPAEVQELTERLVERMERENKTLQELLNVDDNVLEEFYAIAHAHYTQGKYFEALHFFRLLLNFAPQNGKFLFGLASTFYQLNDYENASLIFAMTFLRDNKNALAAYYAADSFIKREEIPAAHECLDIAIEICGKDEKQRSLKEKCRLVKKSLEK